jgi:hypothetical protein
MGSGRFVNGKLNFIVSATYVLNATEKTAWQNSLQRASDFLYGATGGQVQFGNVHVIDDNFGRFSAEVILFPQNGLSGGTQGLFGTPGHAMRYFEGDRGNATKLVHEMSHHVWNLGDEYSGPMELFQIDKTTALPDRRTIPVVVSLSPNALAGHQVLLLFGENWERQRIASNTAKQIVVDADFSAPPTTSTADYGNIQRTNFACGNPATTATNFCIMEDDTTPGVVSYCDPSNHDVTQNTDQQVRHGESCWDTIRSTAAFTSLSVPTTTPAAPASPVNFFDILKENRFVVAIDHSNSMTGDQLVYAKEGAKYWIDRCSLADDYLSVIGYNTNNDILLPITRVSAIPNIASVQNDIDALTASGNTNIRDALEEAVTQITSLPNRAVSQAVVLLTDGKHNRPSGSRLIEAAPNLVANGICAATIAIGEGSEVDAADLDDLADETRGIFSLVGLSNPIDIETALIEANEYLRGSVLASDSFDFVPAPIDKSTRQNVDRVYKRHKWPTLNDVLKGLNINPRNLNSVRAFAPYADLFKLRAVYVEKDCERVSFSINYNVDADLDLFLIDPSGQAVTINNSTVRKIGGRSHKIIVVRRAAVGNWKALTFARSLRPQGGTTSARLSVGAENRTLVITGGCARSMYKTSENARVFATARWDHPLTGLKVSAKVSSTSSGEIGVDLLDEDPLSEFSGRYVADFPHLKVGQYKGVISINAPMRNTKADMRHTALHSSSNRLSTRSSCPKFERQIPFYFQITKGRF